MSPSATPHGTPGSAAAPSSRPAWREAAAIVLAFIALAVLFTYPLAFHLTSLTYQINNGDSKFSLWIVGWVAHALTSNPLGVLHANIFFPERFTLAYSESNLGTGLLAAPVYWLTGSVYAAHGFVLILSFVLTGVSTYYLVRYVVADRRAAFISGVAFAFTPFLFGHLSHIHLLMTAGLPLSLLAFHRLADRPSAGRGAALGAAMAFQALTCGYYAVFEVLLIGYATLFTALSRRLWTSTRYWRAIGAAALVALLVTAPLLLPVFALQRDTGFARPVEEGRLYAASWREYLASGALAHRWGLSLVGRWTDLLFPGFISLFFGIAGVVVGWMTGGRRRELTALYVSIGVLSLWISFGPAASLYSWLHATVPGFNFLRVPSRFGLLVMLALAVLAGVSLARLFEKMRRPALPALALAIFGIAELYRPIPYSTVPAPNPAHRILATLPRAGYVELPLYSQRFAFVRADYMLNSTTHWMPLVNGFSDYTPKTFLDAADVLGQFPTRESLRHLVRDGVRYAVFHTDRYGQGRDALVARLQEFAPHLRRLYGDDKTWLYEIVSTP